jgi:uncharacterized membrane protein
MDAVRRPARSRFGTVLLALAVTLILGFLEKAEPGFTNGSCLIGLVHGSQAAALCYSDVLTLYGTESLQGHRLPYLQPCPPLHGNPCDEYPPVTMYTMWLGALVASGYRTFFYANAFLLSMAALTTAACLYFMAGSRSLYFALAPTRLLYGFFNWDLVAVGLATAATLAFVSRRDGVSGILIGLGTAAKLYPALLLIPFVIQRLREGNVHRAVRLAWAAMGAWLAVNLPFALLAPRSWSTFFRFNGARPLNVDSLWYIGCRALSPMSDGQCVSSGLVNLLTVVLMVSAGAALWLVKTRRHGDWPRWTFAFPLIALFLLTNKVYSPQYSLWLLPWFALVVPGLGPLSSLTLFLMFEATDVAVFVTELLWFSSHSGSAGLPEWIFALAVVARDFTLALCIVAWVRNPLPSGQDVKLGAQRGGYLPALY